MSPATPIIVCGRTSQIANKVIEFLKPEFEVIHVILSLPSAKTELPLLLNLPNASSTAIPCESSIGSRNYSEAPFAVLIGGGYDDQAVAELEEACKADLSNMIGKTTIPWLRVDTTKPAPPPGGPEYGNAVAGRAKECLLGLKEAGGVGNERVIWF
ncbi:hypothetical protein FQN50_009373 [Emmonsiellopsis sp. PD_5]|nr:hypothetical protein FQN50_009373 [Emmonsiellopsis sp. PD_5]